MAEQGRSKFRLKRGDVVQVIAGDEAAGNKSGKVMRVLREKNRVVVEGVNLVKKHVKKSQDYPQGGIVEKEAPIHVSNLRLVTRGAGGRGESKA